MNAQAYFATATQWEQSSDREYQANAPLACFACAWHATYHFLNSGLMNRHKVCAQKHGKLTTILKQYGYLEFSTFWDRMENHRNTYEYDDVVPSDVVDEARSHMQEAKQWAQAQ